MAPYCVECNGHVIEDHEEVCKKCGLVHDPIYICTPHYDKDGVPHNGAPLTPKYNKVYNANNWSEAQGDLNRAMYYRQGLKGGDYKARRYDRDIYTKQLIEIYSPIGSRQFKDECFGFLNIMRARIGRLGKRSAEELAAGIIYLIGKRHDMDLREELLTLGYSKLGHPLRALQGFIRTYGDLK